MNVIFLLISFICSISAYSSISILASILFYFPVSLQQLVSGGFFAIESVVCHLQNLKSSFPDEMLRSSLLCSKQCTHSYAPTANVNANIFIAVVNNPYHRRSHSPVLARNINFGICCTYHSIKWKIQAGGTSRALHLIPSET